MTGLRLKNHLHHLYVSLEMDLSNKLAFTSGDRLLVLPRRLIGYWHYCRVSRKRFFCPLCVGDWSLIVFNQRPITNTEEENIFWYENFIQACSITHSLKEKGKRSHLVLLVHV